MAFISAHESANCKAADSHSGSFSQLNHLVTHPHSGSLPHSAEWNWKSMLALQWGPWIDALSVKSCRCTWSLSPSAMRLQRWDQDQQGLILKPKNRLGCLAAHNVLFGQAQTAEFVVLGHRFRGDVTGYFTLLSDVLLFCGVFLKKDKNRMIKKIFHSLQLPHDKTTYWKANQFNHALFGL